MIASQFPGQTLQPIPGITGGEGEYSVLQKICQLLYNQTTGGGTGQVVNVGGFEVPLFNDVKFTYYSGTNNIQTQKFYNSGSLVATLTFSYVSGGAANDDLVNDIQQS